MDLLNKEKFKFLKNRMVEDKLAGRFFWEEVCSVFESRLP